LHVAITAGQETARTYLAWPVALPLNTRLTGGTLELPLDLDPASGSASPETADFVACLTTPDFEPVRGSFATPPEADCEIRRAAAYHQKKSTFTIDLARFAESWSVGEAAVALVPSERAVARGDAWHVAFPAGDQEPPDEAQDQPAAEITVTMEYVASSSPPTIGTDFDTDVPATVDGGSAPAAAPPLADDGTGFTSTQAATEAPEASAPTELAAEQTQPVVSFIEGFAGPGFAYPIIWALPLVLLVGLVSIGRVLTKDLYRRGL
jgi:hypothetical protein